jgi:acetate kinase
VIILVINCGSSSLKFKLYDIRDGKEVALAEGIVEEIGKEKSRFTCRHVNLKKDEKIVKDVTARDHTEAVGAMNDIILDPKCGLFKEGAKIDAIGHRVVHGGEKFSKSALITPGVISAIEECISIAPLHNPPNLLGIRAGEAVFPGTPQVAVFDTAFHQTMPRHAYLYGLPYEQYERYHIRKYGFHGTSHEFVAKRAAELMNKEFTKVRLITSHMGNGSSITAIKNGESVDTSMGLTPLEGLLMGTRTGDMDPAVVLHLMDKEQMTTAEVNDLCNKKSGFKGISGVSNDLRELLAKAAEGHARCQLAIDMFCYRITKYIGSYAAAMGGVDAIIFTGGIGENAVAVREKIIEPLAFMGITLDKARNASKEREKSITTGRSKVKVFVIPTNEELSIARKTKFVVEESGNIYR